MTVRAFVPGELALLAVQVGQLIELDEDESRYLLKVRRVRPGEVVELLDGRGHRSVGTLAAAGRRARVEVRAAVAEPAPCATRVLLLGLAEPAATLDALTGACELGVTEVVLVRCERSQGHPPSQARIERVLRAAMRQCGRPSPPELLGVLPGDTRSLIDALAHRNELPGIYGDPDSSLRLASAQSPGPSRRGEVMGEVMGSGSESWEGGLRLLVGPEGGLCPAEVEAARVAGFRGLCLGPWILRTPTAVVALLARVGT